LITAFLSLLTVCFTFLAAFEASGSYWTGLLAGGLLAFLPEFAFRGMNISNDAMVAFLAAAGTYGIVRLLRRGFSWQVAVATALCAALALLAKVNGIAIGIVLGGLILALPAPWPVRLKRAALVPAAFLIAIPWAVHNMLLYGDPLASNAIAAILPGLVDRKTLLSPYFVSAFPSDLWHSFVGMFGWMNVAPPPAIYEAFAGIGILAGCGLMWRLIRRGVQPKPYAVIAALTLMVALSIALLVRLNLTFTQPQGRLLFPALPALSILVALGLEALPGWSRWLSCGTVLAAAALNLFVLTKVIVPQYWMPMPESESLAADISIPDTLITGGPAGPLNPGGDNYGQTFTARKNNLTMIEVEIGTYRGRLSRGYLNLHLRKSPRSRRDIASVAIPAGTIGDCTYARLRFPPIPDSAHQSYYLMLDTKSLAPEEHLTVFLSSQDVYPDGRFLINGIPYKDSDTCFRTFYARDLCPCCTRGPVPEDSYAQSRP
jgi:Dolichyl-phosphate-mannose-protein mannosyltransferase